MSNRIAEIWIQMRFYTFSNNSQSVVVAIISHSAPFCRLIYLLLLNSRCFDIFKFIYIVLHTIAYFFPGKPVLILMFYFFLIVVRYYSILIYC
jgi:hypothetical protein